MARRSRPARHKAWGIINPHGDIWTHDTFETAGEARAHVRRFWADTNVDPDHFEIVRVKVTVSLDVPAPSSQERR
jgi:hypothetical protein